MRKGIFSLALAFAASLVGLGQNSSEKVQKMTELFVSAYNAQRYGTFAEQFNAQMKAAITGEKLKEFLDDLRADAGKIVKLGPPAFVAPGAANFSAEFERGRFDLMMALDSEGKVAGFQITAASQPAKPKNTSRNQTKLTLPVKGEWLVFWGGDAEEQNYHHNAPNQRFAVDILKVDESGKTHKGDGTKNEDYYAFGQEIVAPADGVVAYVVDGIHDNKPGEMNRMFIPGNLVVIRHADNEYSLVAHFKQNSIRVKVGDKVARGQVIGLCGNSGNSSEAHLHFQVQNAQFFADEGSMKIFFEKITVKRDGKTEVRSDYSPVKGDIIGQQ